MPRQRSLAWIGLLALLFSPLPALGSAGAGDAQQASAASVDPYIVQQMAASADGTAGFFVLFRQQADLSPAREIADWDLRGRFVYEALRATAERSQRRVRSWLEVQGMAYQSFVGGNRLFITADESLLRQLAAFPEVGALRGNHLHPLAPILPGETGVQPEVVPWNIAQVGADQVWADFDVRGQGILVAHIDTGAEYTHSGLYSNYHCAAGPHDDCWYDPENLCPGGEPCDDNGHGTHVMGVMVADDNPLLPYSAGMAPDAQWIACKGCTVGGCSELALTACADWMLAPNGDPANRPHVVNNSWGGAGCDAWYRPYVQAWRAAGIFPAFSPGGGGPSCMTVGSPSDYAESFATGGTDQNDQAGVFSARGPSCWGEIKPEVVAPAIDICTTDLGDTWTCNHNGTSFSSPHSAGLVALLWSADPTLIGDLNATEQVITSTAFCIEDLGCGGNPCPGGNNVYGWGRLDAYAAVASRAGGGYLEGAVTAAGSGMPIAGAELSAQLPGTLPFVTPTNPIGYYTMSLPIGVYTVTAGAYGYLPEAAYGVEVVTGVVATQDFSLTALPSYVVSGTVTEAGSGMPLHAEIAVLGTPLPPVWSDPLDGFYSLTVASSTYTFRVAASLHRTEEREVVVDHDQTQDFALDLLSCVLLVDDDQDNPDVRSFYAEALDLLGTDYTIWDVQAQGDPPAGALYGYPMVIWFTGFPFGDTFNDNNEAAVSAYLDAGGSFFLSSQDYLFDAGITPLGRTICASISTRTTWDRRR